MAGYSARLSTLVMIESLVSYKLSESGRYVHIIVQSATSCLSVIAIFQDLALVEEV